MKRIRLFFVFCRWCFNDFVENYQDIKSRYQMDNDPEVQRLLKELEELTK